MQPGHNWGGDYAMYLAQAKHLLQGNLNELAVANHYAMDQSDKPLGPVLYPMGYPALLAPLYYMVGLNFLALKIFSALFFIGSIPLVYSLLSAVSLKKELVLFATVLFAINYQLINMVDSLGSDIPAMFFSLLALFFMVKTRENDSLLNAVLIGLTIFLSYSIRVAGLVLIPSLMVFHLCQYLKTKEFKLINVALPYFIFAICYFLYGKIFGGLDSKYLVLVDTVTQESIVHNIISYGECFIQFFVNTTFFPKFLSVLAALVFFPVLAIGIKSIISRDNLFLLCYCAAILVLYILYPFTTIRFIIPLSAFVMYAIFNGINILDTRFIKEFNFTKYLSLALIVAGLMQSLIVIYVQKKKDTNHSLSTEMQSIYAYINEHVSDDEIFVFHKPRVLRLFTDNNGFYLEDFSSNKVEKVDYLLVNKDSSVYPGFEFQKAWDEFQLMKKIE